MDTLLQGEDSAGCSSYSSGATKATNFGRKTIGTGIKDKITKLFNFHTGVSTSDSAELADDKDFELTPSFRQFRGSGGSKGKRNMKRSGGACKVGPMKRKVNKLFCMLLVYWRTPAAPQLELIVPKYQGMFGYILVQLNKLFGQKLVRHSDGKIHGRYSFYLPKGESCVEHHLPMWKTERRGILKP